MLLVSVFEICVFLLSEIEYVICLTIYFQKYNIKNIKRGVLITDIGVSPDLIF